MSETPLSVDHPYLVKHMSQIVCGEIGVVCSRLDVANVTEQPAEVLRLNDIGVVTIETHRPIFCDPYSANRNTGSFILIDPITNLTVGAGMIEAVLEQRTAKPRPTASEGMQVWFTGLSSAGKSTLSSAVYERLWARGHASNCSTEMRYAGTCPAVSASAGTIGTRMFGASDLWRRC